ncbi:hypothetical protein GCM10028791_04120 [Echinicola sediminis]
MNDYFKLRKNVVTWGMGYYDTFKDFTEIQVFRGVKSLALGFHNTKLSKAK